jgi:glycine/D-amino acid oxidase-like deaminating enzyme/nitrite reductase/ring-hydroxylating ferredoxin subunit
MGDAPPERAEDDVESLWLATTPRTDYDPLDGDLRVDVAVVGGGITGLTAALNLTEAGREVALLEADRVCTGTSGNTTAKLTSQHGLKYESLCSKFGNERAKQYATANEAAIDEVEARLDEFGVDADFERTPAYVFAESDDHVEKLRDEAEAARRLGLPAEFTESTDAPFEVAGALRFDDQAQFHPREYLLAVAEAVADDGSHVFEETKAVGLDAGSPCRVETNRATVTADEVVVATLFPFADRGGYFARMHPSRAYLLAVELAETPPDGMYLGSESPSSTFRPHPAEDEELLIVGGQSHKPSADGPPTSERYRRCEEFAREHFPVESIRYRWSSHDYVPVDGVPFIGQLGPGTDNVYAGVGFAKWGMSGGTAAGMILSDLIVEGSNPWADVFDPMRFLPSADSAVHDSMRAVSSGMTFLGENATVATRWVGDRAKTLLSLGVDEADLPEPGEGRVVRQHGRPTAVYRDESGELHASSAVCPHMYCIVTWNDAERTWDCPCHGSRFDCDGTVERGPALEDLSPRDM